MISGEVQMQAVPDRIPNKQCWILFKMANLDRLQALQRGLIYMNSVNYFAALEGEAGAALRRDELEHVYLKLSSGIRDGVVSELALQIQGRDEIVLNSEAVMTVHLPRPETIMVYCMGSVSAGHDGQIWGLDNGMLHFSERFREFGTHVLRITNHGEFSRRLSQAIRSHPHLYNSPFFEGGYGQVDYVHFSDYRGPIGLFRKPIEYAWQREYRLCFGAEPAALNDFGAVELNIGDLSDITHIETVESFTSNPMTLIQRNYRIIDGESVQVTN
ncbi:Uncharacterized protein ALO38_01120 [Pseudomonas coronafaciens pv. zizaniae]|nr:Uncharacterized protein ALO38_01120 [Pseudomonas coronafaciens pv. zizaniae]